MTSQNSESNNRSSSATTTVNKNTKVGQSVLMKEKNRNQINNKNILLLNRSVIDPSYSLKNTSFLQINPTTSSGFLTKTNISKLIHSGDETFFDSDVEIIDECDNAQQYQKAKIDDSKYAKSEEPTKKETPLLQIFDGNVVISQELSIEEVQNLLYQINSKLQSQNNVNSTDFPNITFSKEENSDVEIVLEDGNGSETGRRNQILPDDIGSIKSGKWIGRSFDSNNRKVLLKSVAVNDEAGKVLNQPSTSSETNLLISFKTFEGRKSEGHDFEHDYSTASRIIANENACQKKIEAMVEHVIVENADAELMQIELIEASNGSANVTAVTSSNCVTDKGRDLQLYFWLLFRRLTPR